MSMAPPRKFAFKLGGSILSGASKQVPATSMARSKAKSAETPSSSTVSESEDSDSELSNVSAMNVDIGPLSDEFDYGDSYKAYETEDEGNTFENFRSEFTDDDFSSHEDEDEEMSEASVELHDSRNIQALDLALTHVYGDDDAETVTPINTGAELGGQTTSSAIPEKFNDILTEAVFQSRLRKERDDECSWILTCKKALRDAHLALQKAESDFAKGEENREAAAAKYEADLQAVGISAELLKEYEAFCESLHPEFGLRSGFSITCHGQHGGNYINYDSTFNTFKECVEISYKDYNWRCEASTTNSEVTEDIVEFFPIASPEPLTGTEISWGEQFPNLYHLAMKGARNGSKIAMEILVSLPDMGASFKKGWLFDYEFDENSKGNLVVSRRWKFRSAHKIDDPISVEDKRKCLEILLRPEYIQGSAEVVGRG